MYKLAKYVRKCVVFWKNYTADKNFTRPPVATVATNFKSVHKCAGKSYYHQYSRYGGVLHLHREDRMLCRNAMKTISDVARIEISIVSLFGMLRKPQTCI